MKITSKFLFLAAALALLGAGCATKTPPAQKTSTSSNKNLAEQGQKLIEKRYGKEEDYCALFTTASGKYIFTPEDARGYFPTVKEWVIKEPKKAIVGCDFVVLQKDEYERDAKIDINISYLLTYDAVAEFSRSPNKYSTYQTIADIGDGAIFEKTVYKWQKKDEADKHLIFKSGRKSISISCQPPRKANQYDPSNFPCDDETIISIARLVASRLK